jgi:hypothetical protein
MSSPQNYTFENVTVNKPGACDQYLRTNLPNSCVDNYQGLSTGPTIIEFNKTLTIEEQDALNILMANYIDPEVFLVLNHTENITLHSDFFQNINNSIIDNKCIFQTVIYTNQNENNLVLDSMKTVVEYYCPNVQNYLNTTTGNITLEIYDITRDYSIGSINQNLNEIAVHWNTLANQNITTGNTIYRSIQFSELRNACPNYDVILQLRGTQSDANFDYRLHSLQYLFYTEQ